jgi:hypothetical protein
MLLLDDPRFIAAYAPCIPLPLFMVKLQVQLLKRYLDVEGIPGNPEQQAKSQDQGSSVDQEVPVVECRKDSH